MSVEEKENEVDITVLRAEIKKWENDFRIANGRKAGRADIKGDAIIKAKYKQFDVLSGRTKEKPVVALPPPQSTPKKTTRHPETNRSLSQRPKPVATPRKTPSKAKPTALQPSIPSPVQEIEATPAYIRAALGPTPQKDGQVLGIFDIVEEETPVKIDGNGAAGGETGIAGTPSKAVPSSVEHPVSRTPHSVGKRHFLDAFAGTPLKRKRDDDAGTSSALKRKFATPSFLRRSFPLASIDEETAEGAPKQPPFKKRGLVRSLSSIIQGLKKQEEERMDDDWDILQEIEEQAQEGAPKKAHPKVLVPEGQGVDMPLGPDQGVESSDESSGPDEEAKARKPWKKKGLKRQTRRTNMKPVLHKAKKADEVTEHPESEDELVAETQLQGIPEDEEQGSDAEFADEKDKSKAKTSAMKRTEAATDSKASKAKPRKVNPEAHANYRALKIKKKNSKGKGGGRRFGRR